MVDFEAAVWQAVNIEFPEATVKGCTFHFSQAIWRKVQDVGLQRAYLEKRLLHKFIRYAKNKQTKNPLTGLLIPTKCVGYTCIANPHLKIANVLVSDF